MSKNDGGSAMNIGLESLRLVIAVLDYDEQDIAGARHIVELALAELAAHRIIEAVIHQHTAGAYNEQ